MRTARRVPRDKRVGITTFSGIALAVLVTSPLEKIAWPVGSFFLKPSMVLGVAGLSVALVSVLAGVGRLRRSVALAGGILGALTTAHLLSAWNATVLYGDEGAGRALAWAALYITLYAVFFAVVWGTQNQKKFRRALRWWGLLGVLLAVYGLAQAALAARGIDLDSVLMGVIGTSPPRTGLGSLGSYAVRITGPMGDPNNFGAYLTTVWPVLAAMALTTGARRRSRGLLLGAGVVICLFAIALTLSRSALMGTVAAAGLMFWLLRKQKAGWRFASVSAAGSVIVSVALVVLMGDRLSDVVRLRLVEPPAKEITDRTMLYGAALSLYGSAPLTGTGLGTYEYGLRDVFGVEWPNANPHSAYLSWLSDTGLLGFALNAVILAMLVSRVVAARRRGGSSPGTNEYTAGLLAACLGWLVTNVFYQTYTYQYSWVLYALLYNAPELTRGADVLELSGSRITVGWLRGASVGGVGR